MSRNEVKCFRCVDEINLLVKNGKTQSGKQRYLCKICKATRVENYTYSAYKININQQIFILTKEGLGIRSTARFLQISTTTLLKRILLIANSIRQPMIPMGKEYEVDELCTYVGEKRKRIWLVCALERQSRNIVSFNIGRRTNSTLKKVTDTLHLSQAKKIFTDKLPSYRKLIDRKVHKVVRYGINHLERFHLTLRTHLKRLSRRTICFSKSVLVLDAVLRIYFWF